jgi:hypothetical protein
MAPSMPPSQTAESENAKNCGRGGCPSRRDRRRRESFTKPHPQGTLHTRPPLMKVARPRLHLDVEGLRAHRALQSKKNREERKRRDGEKVRNENRVRSSRRRRLNPGYVERQNDKRKTDLASERLKKAQLGMTPAQILMAAKLARKMGKSARMWRSLVLYPR